MPTQIDFFTVEPSKLRARATLDSGVRYEVDKTIGSLPAPVQAALATVRNYVIAEAESFGTAMSGRLAQIRTVDCDAMRDEIVARVPIGPARDALLGKNTVIRNRATP